MSEAESKTRLKHIRRYLSAEHRSLIACYGFDAWAMGLDFVDAKLYGITHPKKAKNMSEPDWTGKCENCGASPIVPETGMCGPCTFGEADIAGGNW